MLKFKRKHGWNERWETQAWMKLKAMDEMKGQENNILKNQNLGTSQQQWIKVEVWQSKIYQTWNVVKTIDAMKGWKI